MTDLMTDLPATYSVASHASPRACPRPQMRRDQRDVTSEITHGVP